MKVIAIMNAVLVALTLLLPCGGQELGAATKPLPAISLKVDTKAGKLWFVSITSRGDFSVFKSEAGELGLPSPMFKGGKEFIERMDEFRKKGEFLNLKRYYNAPIPGNPSVEVFFGYENSNRLVMLGWMMPFEYPRVGPDERKGLGVLVDLFDMVIKEMEASGRGQCSEAIAELKEFKDMAQMKEK